MAKKCLNCNYERNSTDLDSSDECPKCGAIYSKMEALRNARLADANKIQPNRKDLSSRPVKKITEKWTLKHWIVLPFFLFGIGSLIYTSKFDTKLDRNQPVEVVSVVGDDVWFRGGTLHNSNLRQWTEAAFENKRATSGDFIVSILGQDEARNMSRLRNRAEVLVRCIDSMIPAISSSYDISNENVSGTALLCIQTLNNNDWQ